MSIPSAPVLVIRPTDDGDDLEFIVEYLSLSGIRIAAQTIDFSPRSGSWMSPREQSEAVTDAVRKVWDAAHLYYTGVQVDHES